MSLRIIIAADGELKSKHEY